MKIILICLSLLSLLFGCATHCKQSTTAANKIIIHVDTSHALIVLPSGQELREANADAMNVIIADAAQDKIVGEIEKKKLAGKIAVVFGNECLPNGIAVEGKLTSIGKDRIGFKPFYIGQMRLKITDCDSKTVLYSKRIDVSQDNFSEVPQELGLEMGKVISRQILTCR